MSDGGSYGDRLLERYFPEEWEVLQRQRHPVRASYWTRGMGTRHETRVKRCGICGNTQEVRPGDRFGPCPYKAQHRR